SGGQMQRVGIARALAQRPQVILADEPVASLDPNTAHVVMQYLRETSRTLGITVVCNLHQVELARAFADRIVGLANGRLVFDGQPGQLDEAALQHIYHTPSANEPAQAMAAPRPMLATGTGASA
ncbi:MAG: ATP-binding cassette domain-containing protein, partial [Pseudomonas sp.]